MALSEFVKQWREVAERRLAGIQTHVVEEGHNAGHSRGRAAGASNILRRTIVHNLISRGKRCNVGIRTARLVEKLGIRGNAAREICGDGLGLEGGLREHIREATATRAPRALFAREDGDGRATNGSNIGAACGPVGHKDVRIAADARVPGCKEHGATAHTKLLKLDVCALNVGGINRALNVAVAERVDPGRIGRVEHGRRPVEKVLLAIIRKARLRDEPGCDVAPCSLNVLHVQLRLHARVVCIIGSSDNINITHGNVVVLLELGEVTRAVVLLEESSNGLRALGICGYGTRQIVRSVDRVW
eukprot:Opistho-2@61611